jgi:uncharacterized membrane protein YkoI
MKINRFVALAVIVILVVSAMGVISLKAFAKGNTGPAAQVTQAPDCSQDQADGNETQDAGSDTDNVDLQCGDQNAPDGQEAVTSVYTDTTEVQEGDQNAPDGQEEVGIDAEGTTDAETTALGTPAITVEQAQAAVLVAHPGTVIKTELDDENGQLIYSVELDGGVDIKVDAMTGAILATESGED